MMFANMLRNAAFTVGLLYTLMIASTLCHSCSEPDEIELHKLKTKKLMETAMARAANSQVPMTTMEAGNLVRILRRKRADLGSPFEQHDMAPKQKRFDDFFLYRKFQNNCKQEILLLPSPIDDLVSRNLEVLDNQEICLDGKKLDNLCMPKNPISYQFIVEDKIWTLFVPSNMM